MNSKEITYVTAIAECGRISRAAETLDMSQSALTRSLQNLEEELGCALFKRTSRGLVPTPAGRRYLESAREILRLTREMEKDLSRLNDLQAGHLVIATTTNLGSLILPELLRTFSGVYPGIGIELMESDLVSLEQALLDGRADAAVLPLPLSDRSLVTQPLADDEFYLVVPASDPICAQATLPSGTVRPYLDLALLSHRRFLLTQPSQHTCRVTLAACRAAGFEPVAPLRTSNILTALRMAQSGLGCTLVPRSYCEKMYQISDSVRLFRVPEKYGAKWTVAVCTTPDETASRAVSEFVSLCRAIVPYVFRDENG